MNIMGIPSYFRYLIHHYPSIVQHVSHVQKDTIATLLLDANSIIHECSQQQVSLLEEDIRKKVKDSLKHHIEQHATMYQDTLWKSIQESIWNTICEMYQRVRPEEVYGIFFDGVVPRSKMEQQRKRRFKSAYLHGKKQSIYEKHGEFYLSYVLWDSNCITPGTEFMATLSSFLKEKLSSDSSPFPSTLRVIFSDSDESGEGEHKIMNFLKEVRVLRPDRSYYHYIYGLDADLIMLSMAQYPLPIKLIRNDRKRWTLVDVTILMNSLLQYWKNIYTAIDIPLQERRQWIVDYIVLCFFVGNDFIPCQLSLDIREDAIHRLLHAYRVCKGSSFLVQDDGRLNIPFLRSLCKELVRDETAEVYRKIKKHTRHACTVLSPNTLVQDIYQLERFGYEMITRTIEEECLQCISQNGDWRQWYYDRLFGGMNRFRVCQKYLESFTWMYVYYEHSQPCLSTTWYYPYEYAPTFYDLVLSMEKYPVVPMIPRSSFLMYPIEQLYYVLPKSSLVRCCVVTATERTTDPEEPTISAWSTFGKSYFWEMYPSIHPWNDLEFILMIKSLRKKKK